MRPDRGSEGSALGDGARAGWQSNVVLVRLVGGPGAWTCTARRVVVSVLGLGMLAVAGLIAYTVFEVVTWPGRYTRGVGFGGLIDANMSFNFARAFLFLGPLAIGGALLGAGLLLITADGRRALTSGGALDRFVVQAGSEVVTLAGAGIIVGAGFLLPSSWVWLVRVWLALLGLIVVAGGVTVMRQARWRSRRLACAALAAVVLIPLTATLADHASDRAQGYLVANGGLWSGPDPLEGSGGTWAASGFWTATRAAKPGAVQYYQSVSCPTPTYCITWGNPPFGGSVWSVSTDRGASWRAATADVEHSPSGSSGPEYNSVSCWDSSHCLAVGLSPPMQTSDGGQHWSEVRGLPREPPGSLEMTVYCPYTRRCLILGMRNAKGRAAPLVLATHDGGERWANAEVPPGISELTTVACTGPQDCIGVGSTGPEAAMSILSSTDGGMSWQRLAAPGPALQASPSYIACAGKSACVLFALSVPAPSKAGPDQTKIEGFVTSDNGRMWEKSKFPKLSDEQPPEYEGLPMVACSATLCVSYGPPVSDAPASRSPVLTSTDQGKHWVVDSSALSLAQLARTSEIKALTCDQGGSCVAVGEGADGGGVIYSSHDGGTAWQVGHGVGGGPPWAETREP